MFKSPKILGATIVIMVILNLVFLHTLWRTYISYTHFFLLSILFSIPCMVFYYVVTRKAELMKTKERIILSVIGGYLTYLGMFSTLPFGANFYLSESKGELYSTFDFKTTYDSYLDEQDELIQTTNYKWEHEGIRFSLNPGREPINGKLQYHVHGGLLGFNVVKDINYIVN